MVDWICWFSKDYLTPGCQSMQGCVCFVWWVGSQQNVTVSGNRSCRRELRGCQRKGRSTSLLQNEKRHFFLSAKMLHNTWLSFCHTIKHTRRFPLCLFCSWIHPFSTSPSLHPEQTNLTGLVLHWWKPAVFMVWEFTHTHISSRQVIMSEH